MAVMNGTSGADFLAGLLLEMNEIYGFGGGDTVLGGWRADVLDGGDGDDTVWGDGGNDTILGGAANDALFGSNGNDDVKAGSGSDYVSGGKGDDIIDAGSGDDVVVANTGNDSVVGGFGNDYLFGSSGDDRLDGGAGNDYLDGGSGDDTLVASSGSDSYIGGSGHDTLDLSAITGSVNIDLSNSSISFMQGIATFSSSVDGIEKIIGGNGGMHATGDKTDNVFVGGTGDDWMRGKGGADSFTGGAGRDTYSWLKKDVSDGMGVDHVTDFAVGQDVMDLSDFVKGGQAYEKAIRMVDTADGVLVQGNAKGVWTDIAVLDGLDLDTSGANGQMTLADLGLMA